MRRTRPWVKKAVLATVILAAVGAGLSFAVGEHGRDAMKVVRVSQEFHGRPAGSMKIEMKNGEDAAVPALRGEDAALSIPAQGPMIGGRSVHIEPGLEHGIGSGVAVAGTILVVGLLWLWVRRRGKRSRVAEGSSVLAGIPTASDFLDQWEIQQNQTKESK
ncbi:hypothetical protein M3194_02315 [Paenibacillus glycanilyticus]|uniref:hypothetical protein n=1 Tax=Paenibacillus glycanilyticus TaxID=126569 RepID=UPI00203CDFBA|nr:hypothetical protein [Paenibacillus glycanilyticus]MCM3626200.1 hypothetical protein [Paenibacillus glycanilyticus]